MIAARLLGFADALRKNGVRAAEGEVLDAMRALTLVDVDAFAARALFRDVLRATLAKTVADEDVFDRVFELCFGFDHDAAGAVGIAELLRQRGVAGDAIERILDELARCGADIDAALAALLAGDSERLGDAVRAALDDVDVEGLQSPLQVSYFTSRLMQRLGAGALASLESRLKHALQRDLGDAGERQLHGAVWDLEERLRRTARRAVERELEKRTVTRPARRGALLERDLRAVDPAEIEELRLQVRRLAAKLKTRLIVRRRRARRGRVDPRATLRKSVATDAVPLQVVLSKRRPARPEIVILCDVSDSVRSTSLFMLELVAAVADVLKRARSFVFVDRIGEVTELFRGPDPVTRILNGDVVPVSTNSDYGKVLRAFWERERGTITRKTTVVILGDGRGNYRPPEDWVLAEIRRRARKVIWLSPEERATWGFGDSDMHRFARHADAIHVVRTVTDLAKAVDRIAR